MTNSRKYRSPIRFLNALGLSADEISSESIRAEQSKLLNSLHSNHTENFYIGGQTVTRAELIEFTQSLDSLDSLKYHQLIFEHSPLLDLLENHRISGNKQADYRLPSNLEEENLQRLGKFISPYLASAIDQLLVTTLEESSYSELEKIAPLYPFLSEQDGVFAFRKLKEWSNSLDERLNDPRIIRFEYPVEKYVHFHYAPFYKLINTASKFYPNLPDVIGDALTIFALSYKRSRNREDSLLKISTQLQGLNCSPRSKQMILNNHAQFRSETKDSGKPNRLGLWLTIGSVVVALAVLLIFLVFRDSRVNENAQNRAQLFEDFREAQRRANANTRPSPSRVLESDFNLEAFKLFHEHTYACVLQKEFEKNEFVWDGVPDIKSPLVLVDSANMQPKGKKVFLENKTNSDLLMVVLDENSLSTHFVSWDSKIRVNIDPNALIFFYAGSTWFEDESIVYDHPYKNIMTESWTLRYTGRFKTTTAMDERFLKNMYILSKGSVSDLQITQEKGQYVFKGKHYKIKTI